MRGLYKRNSCLIFSLIAVCLMGIVCMPMNIKADDIAHRDKMIVFVLDTSGSMKANDPERLAVDGMAQLIYSLPSDYQVGFVAYNSKIAAKKSFVPNEERSKVMEKAEAVDYTGYSNAGDGLSSAVGMFADRQAGEKYIVMISDGEVLMDSKKYTRASRKKYQQAVKQAAEEDIQITIIGLGDEMKDSNNFIFSAAESTGGSTYYKPQAREIQNAIDSVLTNDLRIKQSTVAIMDADGKTENISTKLPYKHADKIRIILTSTGSISNLTAKFQADYAEQVKGSRYSLIEIEHPTDTELDLKFEGTKGNQFRVNIIPEYAVGIKEEVTYTDAKPSSNDIENVRYNRTAVIKYSFYDEKNDEIQLWKEDFFDNTKINLLTNGQAEESFLNGGILEQTIPVTNSMTLSVEPDFSQMPVNVVSYHDLTVKLEQPPLLPAEKNQVSPVLIIILSAGIILIAGIILLILKRVKSAPVPIPAEDKPEPSKYSYMGRINIYITRTQTGYDIPPLAFDLFRIPSGKVISLKEILESCDVTETFDGADMIYFKPGAKQSLILTNNSDCTIMKNREILMKKKSYQLQVGAKVDITFEDEISELTFQYKESKPSAI